MDLFSLQTMIVLLEQLLPAKSFFLDMFFVDQAPVITETVQIDIVKGSRRMAPMQSPLLEGKVIANKGFTTNTYTPAYIKPKMVTTAQQLLKRLAGETVYGSSGATPMSRAQAKLAKDLATLKDMVKRRKEWMAATALTTGQIPIVGDGVSYVIDFLMNATHKVTLATSARWSETTSDPIADLITWRKLILTDSGLVADTLVFGDTAWATFKAHAKVQEYMKDFGRMFNSNVLSFNPVINADGSMFLGRIEEIGCDLYLSTDVYLPDGSDTNTPLMPLKSVLMGCRSARCDVHYAAIQDLDALAALAEFPKTWTEKDPSAQFLQLQSAPLPAVHQPDAFVIAQVQD